MMTIFTKLVTVAITLGSLPAFAWDESYLLQCEGKDQTTLQVKFSLEHAERDAITGVREQEPADWTVALRRRVDQLSVKNSKLNTVLKSENTSLKIDINADEAVLTKKVGKMKIKLDTNSQLCSTNPNKIAKEYRGDLTITQGKSKVVSSVTCIVKRMTQD